MSASRGFRRRSPLFRRGRAVRNAGRRLRRTTTYRCLRGCGCAVSAGRAARRSRNVPADRAGDWVAVCGGVPGVWDHANDGEMAVFYVLDPDSDGNRFARAAAAGHGELAGICGGAYVFRRLCRRTMDSRGFSCGDSYKCDCQDLRREFLTEFLARLSEAFCSGAWRQDTKAVRGHEGMGMGDVKMIAMIGAFLGLRGRF